MTEDQVDSYLGPGGPRWNHVCSNNRERQFANSQLKTPMTEILGRHGTVWPSRSDYASLARNGSIREEDPEIVTVTARGSLDWKSPIEPARLAGMSSRPMPGI
ncbi:MAG: hypothetical protein U0904_02065 [Candidatus Nanopelagicales bacterium]|nr:hypothetical protein [Candidatus Nanopelagicales bacterium]